MSLNSVEFQDPAAFPHTSWRRKSKAKDNPSQKEVILLDPEVLAKAQYDLVRSHTNHTGQADGCHVDPAKTRVDESFDIH